MSPGDNNGSFFACPNESPKTIASLIGHALYDVGHHGIYLKTSVLSAFLPSTRRRDTDVYLKKTSGMVAKHVAATRGSFVPKNFPFV